MPSKFIDLLIIAGGKGTRISKYFPNTPKALLKVNKKTLLENSINMIPHRNLYLSLGHMSQEVVSFMKDGDIEFKENTETKSLGSFGGLKDTVLRFYESLSDKIIIILGDLYICNVAYDIEKNYSDSANLAFFSKNDHPEDSDRIDIDSNGVVKELIPKTFEKKSFLNKTLSGFYIFHKDDIVQSEIVSGDIGMDFIPYLLKKNKLKAKRITGIVKDVGTKNRLDKLNELLKKEHSPVFNKKKYRKRVAFFDLDGTIIEDRGSKHHNLLKSPKLIKKAIEIISFFNSQLIPVIVVSNQGDIAKGFKTEKEFNKDITFIEKELAENKCWIDDVLFCPHYPKSGFKGEIKELKVNCECRKPKIGMYNQADTKWEVDPSLSLMFGNSESDREFANNSNLLAYFDINDDICVNEDIIKLMIQSS